MSNTATTTTADPHETTVTSPSLGAVHEDSMPRPGSGRALFSTELGNRASRNNAELPVVVRSNKVVGIVETAMFWRKKFPRASWCIFPESGWKIEDLWDAGDIHLDTREHYTEVLKFISQDNFWCARKFAEDWSRAHPEQLAKVVGMGDMESTYDSANPLAIVDKIFVNGETREKPRQFLWHVAHIMRTTIVDLRTEQKRATVNSSTLNFPSVEHQLDTNRKPPIANTSFDKAPLASDLSAQTVAMVNKAPSKKNRKKSHSQPQELTVFTVPLSASVYEAPAQFMPPPTSNQQGPFPAIKHPLSYGPLLSDAYQGQTIGHMIGETPAHTIVSPTMSIPTLRNPKGRSRPDGSYNQTMLPGAYVGTISRVPHGVHASRHLSGPVSSLHSPHFSHVPVAIGPPHSMQPYGQTYLPMSPSTYPAQLYHPDLAYPGMMPSKLVRMPGPPNARGYAQQAHNDRRSRGISMEDMTNNQYYTNTMPPYSVNAHQPGGRSSLYDPYGGTKPAFNDSNTGRKNTRGASSIDQHSRSRKPSSSGNRFQTASYGADGFGHVSGNGSRYPMRTPMVDDPDIVGDRVRGCHQKWIGPENHTVNELFVSELPEDVEQDEVQSMFAQELNITPVRVTIRHNPFGNRPHAFVLFTTASDAKLGLRVSEVDPKIRGITARITVPRRFYQKTEGHHNPHERQYPGSEQTAKRGTRGVARVSSHEEETGPTNTQAQIAHVYSPQDARSDLQKNISRHSQSSGYASGVSPETPKVKTPQRSPSRSPLARPEEPIEQEVVGVTDEFSTSALVLESVAGTQNQPDTKVAQNDIVTAQEPVDTVVSATRGVIDELPNILMDTLPLIVTSTIEHNRVVSQVSTTSDGIEGAAKTVKFQDPQDPVLAVEEAKSEETIGVKSSFTQYEGPDSDDGTDLNSSILSVHEALANTEPTLVPGANPPFTNHGTEFIDASAATDIVAKDSVLPLPLTTPQLPQELPLTDTPLIDTSLIDTTLAYPEAIAPISIKVTDSKDSQDTTVPTHIGPMATTLAQPPVEVVKKHGPQQTSSLNPFANGKLTKAQRQKEKEQKRKEKKREQEEKAVKAKAEKTSSCAALKVPATLTNNKADGATNSTTSLESEIQVQDSLTTTDTAARTPQTTSGAKGKGKTELRAAAMRTADQVSKVGDKEEASSKQTEGTVTKSLDVIGSVTHYVKVAQKNMTISTVSIPHSLAHSPKYSGVLASDQPADTTTPATAFAGDSMKANDVSTVPRIKKATPAVSNLNLNLNLHPRSTRRKISQPGATKATTPSPSVAASSTASQSIVLPSMSQSTRELDAVSIASSDTLHPSDSAQVSPSPTARDFHTPLQTPAIPPIPQDGIPKPKKKKNKKKKKPAAAVEATDSAMSAPSAGACLGGAGTGIAVAKGNGSGSAAQTSWFLDPFGNQMSHIDVIRAATKDEDSYYNKVNREREEQAAKTSSAQEHESLGGLDLTSFRHIQGFLMENPHLSKNL